MQAPSKHDVILSTAAKFTFLCHYRLWHHTCNLWSQINKQATPYPRAVYESVSTVCCNTQHSHSLHEAMISTKCVATNHRLSQKPQEYSLMSEHLGGKHNKNLITNYLNLAS